MIRIILIHKLINMHIHFSRIDRVILLAPASDYSVTNHPTSAQEKLTRPAAHDGGHKKER